MRNDKTVCVFSEELFRIFISMMRIEHHEFQLRKAKKESRKRQQEEEEKKIVSMIHSGQYDSWDVLDDFEKRLVLEKVRSDIGFAEYSIDWDDDFSDMI